MAVKDKISGLIITYNEEKNIQEILECFDFCNEIIIVDSYSNDKTEAIALKNSKVKIIKNDFIDFTTQRNLALDNAKNDWVLFLDGDERITPKLKEEIISTLHDPKKCDAYYFYRQFYFAGKKLNFSGTQNDKNFRMFRKSKAHYIIEKKVHETLKVNGEIGILKNKLLHFSVADYDSYQKKMLLYARLKGEELAEKGKKYNPMKKWAKTFFNFFKSYFIKLGILDGKEGFQLCYLQSLYVYKTYEALRKSIKKT